MVNGKTLTVPISDEEFLAKPQKEQNLLIFKVASNQQADIQRIDEEGCKMVKIRDKKGKRRIVLSVGGITIALTGLIELIKSFF